MIPAREFFNFAIADFFSSFKKEISNVLAMRRALTLFRFSRLKMKAIKVAALLLLLMTVEEGQCYQSSLTRPNFRLLQDIYCSKHTSVL